MTAARRLVILSAAAADASADVPWQWKTAPSIEMHSTEERAVYLYWYSTAFRAWMEAAATRLRRGLESAEMAS